jgi:hypothetical protein
MALLLFALGGRGIFQQYADDCIGGNLEDPFCTCSGVIGSGYCDGTNSEWGRSWDVNCTADACEAATYCDDGTFVTCEGDYSASADRTGVNCRDTGSASIESDYCT